MAKELVSPKITSMKNLQGNLRPVPILWNLQFALFEPLRIFTFLLDRCLELFFTKTNCDKSIICTIFSLDI